MKHQILKKTCLMLWCIPNVFLMHIQSKLLLLFWLVLQMRAWKDSLVSSILKIREEMSRVSLIPPLGGKYSSVLLNIVWVSLITQLISVLIRCFSTFICKSLMSPLKELNSCCEQILWELFRLNFCYCFLFPIKIRIERTCSPILLRIRHRHLVDDDKFETIQSNYYSLVSIHRVCKVQTSSHKAMACHTIIFDISWLMTA